MNPRQRTPQPLERAVTKALARKAERRAEKLAAELESAEPQSLEPPEPQAEHAPQRAADRSTVVHHPAAEPVAAATPVSPPAAMTFEPEQQLEQSAEPPSTRAALPAETMSIIERLAASGPFADKDTEADELRAPAGKKAIEKVAENVAEQVASQPNTPDSSAAASEAIPRVAQPATPAATPAAGQAAEAAPTRRAATGGAPLDAFQLLLSSNPDAGDNTRDDLPDAPAVRNPRKALDAEPGSTGAATNTETAPDKPHDESSHLNVSDQETPEKERSLRNWFSPKSDPNPPAAPESDPLRD